MSNNGTSQPPLQEPKADEGHTNSVIGISLAVAANFLVSVSLNVQKYAHNKNTQVDIFEKLLKHVDALTLCAESAIH